ncbi:MAG: hypothetical protein WC004_03920 [Candidatus Absconditabacterales bacterium]
MGGLNKFDTLGSSVWGLKHIAMSFLLSMTIGAAIAQDRSDGYCGVPDSLRGQAMDIINKSMNIDQDTTEHRGMLFQAVRGGVVSPDRKIFVDYAESSDTCKVHIVGFVSQSQSTSLQLLFCPKTGLLLYRPYINDVLQPNAPQAINVIGDFMNNSGLLPQTEKKPSPRRKVYRI